MAIDFPNQSRSYDPRHHGIRFWGHDDALEVSFLVEEDAIAQIDRTTLATEADFLSAFDSHRDRIIAAARKAYSRRGGGFYVLPASSF
jgi:Protein of unknown function (DUF1488)